MPCVLVPRVEKLGHRLRRDLDLDAELGPDPEEGLRQRGVLVLAGSGGPTARSRTGSGRPAERTISTAFSRGRCGCRRPGVVPEDPGRDQARRRQREAAEGAPDEVLRARRAREGAPQRRHWSRRRCRGGRGRSRCSSWASRRGPPRNRGLAQDRRRDPAAAGPARRRARPERRPSAMADGGEGGAELDPVEPRRGCSPVTAGCARGSAPVGRVQRRSERGRCRSSLAGCPAPAAPAIAMAVLPSVRSDGKDRERDRRRRISSSRSETRRDAGDIVRRFPSRYSRTPRIAAKAAGIASRREPDRALERRLRRPAAVRGEPSEKTTPGRRCSRTVRASSSSAQRSRELRARGCPARPS